MASVPYRVAIIDDEPLVVDMLTTMLSVDGRLEVAASYEDARRAVEGLAGVDLDAVICDVHMPGLDGLKALPVLRRVCDGAVIVMYTADPEEAVTARARGADSVVDKASDGVELTERIVSLIEHKRTHA